MKNNVEFIKRNVKATLAVENARPSPEGEKITEKFLNGEITSSEAIRRIKNNYLEV